MRVRTTQFSGSRTWRSAAAVVALIVVAALALPVLAADPSPGTQPSAAPSVAPLASPGGKPEKPEKADKGNKGNKTPEVAITLRGTVATTTDAKGRPAYSLSSGGKTYELEAGPAWFWGANNPLAKFAGKTVTITGETHAGATDVDVLTVDGTAIRAPGKPAWAGGWKVVGEKHPGWSQAKADRFKAKFGACFPPGQCKKADKAPPVPAGVPGGD